ncbi:hypothetical protein [Xanthobacter sediminis]
MLRRTACSALIALCAVLGTASGARGQNGGSGTAGASDCAALGEGFVRMPGSDTCVRMRSAVRVDAYGGGGLTRGGGFGNTATDLGTSTQNTAPDPWKQAR